MGLLDFNFAEIASRITRGAGVRGRIPTALDDTVLPTALVADWTRAPYRLDEIKGFASRPTANAGAGNGSTIAINNQSPKPVILEWWRLINRGAFVQRFNIGFSPAISGGVDTPFTLPEGAVSFATLGRTPSVFLTDQVTVGLNSPSIITDNVDMITNAAGGSTIETRDTDIVIPPGVAFVFCNTVVNQTFGLSARIRVPLF